MSGQRTIQFSVEFVTAASNFKKIISELQQELSKVKPGTQIYESIAQQIKQAQQLMRNTDFAIEKGITRGSDIDRVAQNFDLLTGRINNIRESLSSLTFPDLNLGHSGFGDLGQQWGFAKTELAALLRQIDELQNKTVGGVLGDKTKGFEGVLDQNALQFYDEIIQKATAAKEQVAQLQAEQARLEGVLANSSTIAAKQAAASPYEKALSAMGVTGGNLPGAGRIADAMINGSADTQGAVNAMLQSLGLDKATIEAVIKEADGEVKKLASSLQNLNIGTRLQNAIQGMTGTGSAKSLFSYVDQLRTGAQEAQNAITQLNNIQQQLNTAQTNVSTLEGQKTTLDTVINPSQITDLQTQVSNLMARIANLESQISQKHSSSVGAGRQPPPNIPPDDPAARAQLAVQEQQRQLGNTIDSYTKRWIGAYAIINKISQTIRKAWSDIQNLDKAMTSIAVVTNMSVSDLWGKLNDYMSIAQQYGVTTQGVYEVSQIYYQQGLSTSEVMAATTETLKLARIAGMDYAAAADAMTVAIRSFKMEMTDAATVTDVYSKVASSTASDSEELAIAMSKTASSAESVGSSFENTTAMLAVMIETTRESAQNLGSALKSIISRYGEMKVGATVDEDGEALDYNKVDTALKSVGISIKDAQGQFRDFDDVIFELSAKWDSLDKNTQRYIATIMAGNRQQSRFIALVDNWERLEEVTGIANNAEDAGLLQYSKTLDSFDAKLNKLKNSFQSFYMQIFNSDGFKGILDILNSILEGFSEMGTSGLAALPSLIAGFRVAFTGIKIFIVKAFSEAFAYAQTQANLVANHSKQVHNEAEETNSQTSMREINERSVFEKQSINGVVQYRISEHARGESMIRQQRTAPNPPPQQNPPPNSGSKGGWNWKTSRGWSATSMGLSLAGAGLTATGAGFIGSGQRGLGAGFTTAGNIASYAGMGMLFGPWGAAIGALIGVVASIDTIRKAFDKNIERQDKLNKATEIAEEKKVKKAEKTEEYNSLESQLNKIKELETKKDLSEGDYEAWAEANDALVGKYPQLFSYMDQYGNKIADLSRGSELLNSVFLELSKSGKESIQADINKIEAEMTQLTDMEWNAPEGGASTVGTWFIGQDLQFLRDLASPLVGGLAWLAGSVIDTLPGDLVKQTEWYTAARNWTSGRNVTSTEQERIDEWLDDNISGGRDAVTSEKLVKYMLNNNINLLDLINRGKAGKLDPNSNEDFLFRAFKAFGIVNKEGVVNEEFSKLYSGHAQLLALQEESLNKQLVQWEILAQSRITSYDDSVEELAGFGDMVLRVNEYQSTPLTAEELEELTEEEYIKLVSPFVNFYEQLNSLDKKDFASIYNNLRNFSFQDLKEKLLSFDGITEDDPIFKAYIAEWEEQNYAIKQQILNSVFDLEIKDFGSWRANQNKEYASTEEALADYQKYLSKKVAEGFTQISSSTLEGSEQYLKQLYNVLFDENNNLTISTNEAENLIDFINKSKEIIEDSDSALAREAAQSRLETLSLIYSEMAKIDFTSGKDWKSQIGNIEGLSDWGIDLTKWNKEDVQAFQNLLMADNAGTMEWQEQLDTLAEKNGQMINWSNATLESLLYTNFNTRINTYADRVKAAVDDLSDLSKKQESGFSWDDSVALLNKLGEGYSWSDIFEVNEEGLIVLKNFNDTLGELYQKDLENLTRYTGQLEKMAGWIYTDKNTGEEGNHFLYALDFYRKKYIRKDSAKGATITAEEQTEWVDTLYAEWGEQWGLDKDTIDNMVSWFIANPNSTTDEFLKYLEGLVDVNEELVTYFEEQLRIVQANASFDTYFEDTYGGARKALTASSTFSLESLKDMAVANKAIEGKKVSYLDKKGNSKERVVYDWETFFKDFEGISINEYGEVTIKDPKAYAESLIELLGEKDQEIINNIYQSVFEQYHTQWQERQAELETLFTDYQFTDQEMVKLYSWKVGKGTTRADMSMEEFAKKYGFIETDGVWEATTSQAYYTMLAYAKSENPDLDFSDLPTWKEWATQRVTAALEEKEQAAKFLRELSIESGPEELEKAIELGLLDANQISDEDLKAFEAGNKTLYELIVAQHPNGFTDPKLQVAWKAGQESYNQEVSKWLNNLFSKSTLTPDELLEIWELLGTPEEDFKTWAEQGFEYDDKTGNYRITADSYEVYAQAAAEKGATEMPSRMDFLQTLHAGEKTQSDARIQALSSLSVEATIHDLDAVYQAGLITDEQYLQAIADAAAGRKTYYESIIENVDRTNKEIDDAIQGVEATQATSALTDADNLFGDMVLDNDSIKKMWLDADTDKDMFAWAEEALGVVYKNGEWIINNVAQAWDTMKNWYKEEYGDDYEAYMPVSNETEFRAMWANYQDTQDEAIIKFIEEISPESGEDILAEAVELGLATWEEIKGYKQQGSSAYSTILAIANKEGSKWTDEQKDILEQGYRKYYLKVADEIEGMFSDGVISEDTLESMWAASGSELTFDKWMSRTQKVEDVDVAFFKKVGDDWIIQSEEAYNEMVQWIADTYGPEFVAALPSYDKLKTMGILADKRREEDIYDFISGFDFEDVGTDDLERAVELGIISQDELNWAIQNNVDFSTLMLTAFSRMNGNAAKALAQARAINMDSKIKDIETLTEDALWTAEEMAKMWASSESEDPFATWADSNFIFDKKSGLWKAKDTQKAYNLLVAWVKKEYGEAYEHLLPTETEFKNMSLFEDKKNIATRIEILKGFKYDFSINDLNSLVEQGFLNYEEAVALVGKSWKEVTNKLATKLSNQEELDAFNQMVTENNIAMGEAALALFEDEALSWQEVSVLWSSQLGEGGEVDIVKWAQDAGLKYLNDEWTIATREGYEAIVDAAKKIYGDAWEAATPSYEAIVASQQLEKDINKDKQTDFFEGLASDKEITAEDVQRALELGIVTKEQIYSAQQNGWSYEKLLQFVMANNAEWKAAYQKGYGEYNETRLKELEEMFGDNDNIFSYEQVYRMWEVLGKGVDFNTWTESQGLEFDGTSYQTTGTTYEVKAAKAYALMHGMAVEWWGEAAASMIPSQAAMASLFNIEREIQLDEQLDFMKGLTPKMTMAEAQKAVELGIISQDQLLWLEQSYGNDMTHYFSFISQQFAAIEGADWEAFQESYEDYQTTRMTEVQTFFGKTSFSLADMTDMWQKVGGNVDFNTWQNWAQEKGGLSFDGENWIVEKPEQIWPVLKQYIKELYGFTDDDFAKGGIFANMEQQFLASVHQQTTNAKEKKLSFLRGLSETLTLDDLNEALEAGILTESEYDAVITQEGGYDSDDIRKAIAGSLETPEEMAAYNKAIEQRNLQRIETITALFEDTAISSNEIFEMYKASGATEDIIRWAQKKGFVLEDGKWYAKTKQAYQAMEEYVKEQFGDAYLALLPSEEEWLASGLFDDLIEKESQTSFIKEISPTASASTLKEAAEKFGIEFTQEELLLLEAGVIDYYDILLEKLKTSGNKEWQNWANLIELQNIDAARRNVFEQAKFTTLEDYTAAYQQLADLGFTTREIEYILADQTIDMEETANMIRALEARATGGTGVYLQGEALLAAAKKYNISLADFFERSVLSPTQVLEYLGLTLSNLSAEDYDAYMSAQNNFNSSIQKLFEGTGTAADMQRLIETANQAAIKGYELTTDNFIITAEGIQLDRSQFFTALEILRQTDTNAYRAIRESFVADPSLWGEEINSIADVEERLNDLARQRAELGEKITKENAQQVALLEEQASLYAEIYGTMSMQKSDGWDFLNKELHGNAENFISWSDSVHSAFEQVGSKDGIEPKSFINLLNYMQQMGVQVQTLGTNFNSWADLMQSAYSTFGKAMVTGSKVAITDIGVSAENMSTGMLDAVHAMAESQIKFLDAQIAMLEGLVALEGVDFSGIGDFAIQMQGQLDKYNKAMGLTGDAAIKLEDLKISINGVVYPLTEQGLASAEKAWQALGHQGNFLDHLISQILSPDGQKSIMSGGIVEIDPTANIKLSTDTQATISEIQTANSILREIAANTDPALQERIAKHKSEGGADLSTEAGAIKYFNDNPGVFRNILEGGVRASDKDAYEALSTFDKEIFNMWYASQHGTRFDQSDIYGYWYPGSDPNKQIKTGDGQVTSTGGKTGIQPTFTYHTATKDAYTYEKDENGNWEYRYARGTTNGQFEYLALPSKDKMAEQWDEIIRAKWGSPQAAQGVLAAEDPSIWNEWFATLSPYEQALFYSLNGQTDKLPGYGTGTQGKPLGGPGGNTPPKFDVSTAFATANSELGTIASNTAEANALLAVMASGLDLNTPEGREAYFKALGRPSEGAPKKERDEWLSTQSDFTLGIIEQNYDPATNWAESDAAKAMRIGWERNGLPIDHTTALSLWEDIYDPSNPNFAWAQEYLNMGGGGPSLNTRPTPFITQVALDDGGGWSYDLFSDPRFIQAMIDTHGYEIYQQTSSNNNKKSSTSTGPKTLTEAEIAARNAWLFPEGVSGIGAGNVPTGFGFLGSDKARLEWLQAAGILSKNDAENTKYYERGSDGSITWKPGADGTTPAITELYGTAAFEEAFAGKTGEFLNNYVEAIDDFYDAKALTKGYTRNENDGTITGKNTEGEQVTLRSGDKGYDALNSAFNTITDFNKVMTLYSSMLGVPFDPKMFLDAAGNDKILRTSESLAKAADGLVTATENLEGATGKLDTSVLRLSQALLASGLLPTYAGINPEELNEWDNAVFNIPGLGEVSHQLFDTEKILADFATRYATADSPEVAEGIVAEMRAWNGSMREAYRSMSNISGNALRTEWATDSFSDVETTNEYQAMQATQGTLDATQTDIATKEAEAGTLRTNITENSALLAGVRSALATVQADIATANKILENPESTVEEREAALANLTTLQAQETALLSREAELIQTINADRDTLAATEEELTGLYERQAGLLTTLSTQQSAIAGLYGQEEADWDAYVTELSSILTTLEALKEYYKDEDGKIPDWLTELINYYSAEKTRAEEEQKKVTGKESEYTTAAGTSSSAAEDAEGKKGRTVVIPESPGTQSGVSTSTKTRDEIIAEYQAIIDKLTADGDYDAAGAAIDRYSAEDFTYRDAFATQKTQWDKYQEAMALLNAGDYAAAKTIFENPENALNGFFDSNDQLESLKYTINLNEVAEAYKWGDLNAFKNLLPTLTETDQAKYTDLIGVIESFNNLINSEDYGEAFKLIGTAPEQFQYDFQNELYRRAITLNQNGEIEKALEILDLLGNFFPDDQPTTAKEFAEDIRFENSNLEPEVPIEQPPVIPPEDEIYIDGNTYTLPQSSGGEIVITLDSEGIIKELSGTDNEGEPLKNSEIPLWLIGQSIRETNWENIMARSETDVPFLEAITQLSTMLRDEDSSTEGALAELASSASNAATAMSDAASRFATTQIRVEIIGGVAAATGNVSGLAFAEGNSSLGRLNIGARLAGQTLIGELGPELAVYDGMYHLLGQNGAEFVDLPSDAIVFNHRQTAGIIRGQAGYRGTALAEGNADDIIKGDAFVNGHISGPAFADASGALAQLKSLRAMWQSILGMTAQDLANTGGGGGGGGNSLKAVTAELTEWYNLTRQIENLEQEINNLIAERENIAKDNGETYLRNLRETQKLLQQQKLTQQILLDYQEKQLARQRDHINNHSIWSQFLTIGEDGLLQYIKGNETNDGKGALSVLQQLNAMSGKQQVDFVKKLGYSYTDKDGKKLKDSELVSKFFEELQDQIDQYDELYDTVNGTKETIEGLTSDIEKINDEILENQKELEQDIYDILVEAWEKEIEALEEQTELIEEANKAYVDGLKDALNAEKDLYEKNESTEERESLQRQLSLLRRSGGSASEIADLEEQLNDTLKDEYFKNQERMIKNIEDANEEQVKKLEEQITLQKEALEYQKENGVLWTEVYNVLAGTKEEILKFMQGKHTDFFSQSALKQEEMLTDWAHKIGIYTEERQYENHTKAATTIWDSNDLWNGEILKGMKGRYEGLKDTQKESLQKLFTDTYANSRIKGETEENSRKMAEEEVKKYLNQAYDENGNLIEEPEPPKQPSGNTNCASIKYTVTPAEAKTAGCGLSGPSRVTVGSEKGGVKLQTARGWDLAGFSSSDSSIASYSGGAIKAYKKGSVTITAKFVPSKNSGETKMDYHSGAVDDATIDKTGLLSEKISNFGGFRITDGKTVLQDSGEKYQTKDAATAAAQAALSGIDKKKYPKARYTLYGFSQGGLVDYTGLAMVHGTQSKPEAFLNASQTAQIKEALEATSGKENLLEGLHSTVDKLRSLIHNINTINNSKSYDITIAPGAVVINVDQLADSYDIDALSADIMNRMVSIASKATNRGVNRR